MPSLTRSLPILIAVGIAGYWLVAIPRPGSVDRLDLPTTVRKAATADEVARWMGGFSPYFDHADAEIASAVETEIHGLDLFFERARRGARPFAETALSFRSKWALTVDAIPGTGSGRQETLLREAFERHVFADADLERQLTGMATRLTARIEGIESELLVTIRADLAKAGIDFDLQTTRDAAAARTQAQGLASTASAHSLADDAALLAVSLVIERVLRNLATRIAARLGSSGVVIGAGASASVVSCGVSLAAALVIDQVLSTIWDRIQDPTGTLEQALSDQMTLLQVEILLGDGQTDGLLPQLARWREARIRSLRDAVTQQLGE
ncbi:MAG: hypothetical protein EA381_00505 [Planctomycetaceae bacterium]|nr:MAG: hypothetical protein EA381_00505 [Planctomycetaceae bacterium]